MKIFKLSNINVKNERKQTVNKKELALKIERASKLRGSFKLRSGQISDVYFDKYQFESDPDLLNAITDHFIPMIPENIDLLGGMELGGIPLASVLSLKTKIPCVFIRKKAKSYGTEKQAEGPKVQNKNILLVEDVITTGGAVCDSAKALRKEGGIVEYVISVIHRNSDTSQLNQNNLKLQSLFTLNDFSSL